MSQSWSTPVTLNDWMRNIEKRVMHQERRPQYPHPMDVVGPGFGPYARTVADWNSDGPIVGGHFYSTANQVVNSPNDSRNWMGIVQSNSIGQGLQRVWEYIDTVDAPSPNAAAFTRSFVTLEDGTRNYTDWTAGSTGGGTGDGTGGVVWGPWQPLVRNAAWASGTVRYRRSVDGSLGQLDMNTMQLADTSTASASGNLSPDIPITQLPPDAMPEGLNAVPFELLMSGTYVLFCAINFTGAVNAYASSFVSGTVATSASGTASVVYAAPSTGPAGGGAGTITVQDEDVNVMTGATALDFKGLGVTVTAGDPGEAVVTITGAAYTFVQGTPASTWTIDHPLGYLPNVTVVDSTGRQAEGDVIYTDADTLTIIFSAAFSGKAYLS